MDEHGLEAEGYLLPVCHPERGEGSIRIFVTPKPFDPVTGFFAALRMTVSFVGDLPSKSVLIHVHPWLTQTFPLLPPDFA